MMLNFRKSNVEKNMACDLNATWIQSSALKKFLNYTIIYTQIYNTFT